MVAQTQPDHAPAVALARRYPSLVGDISQWARQDPASTRLSPAGQPAQISYFGAELLLNWNDPHEVFQRLDQRRIVHLFPTVASFLHFVAQPGFADCLDHPNWFPLPLIPPQANNHLQSLLETRHPREWPWPLVNHPHLSDPACRAIGQEMIRALNLRATPLCQKLNERYAHRPSPAQLLRENQRPLRILTFAIAGSSYQAYCARDLEQAFCAAGHEAFAFIPDNTLAINFELLEAIERFDPDVLLLNGKQRSDLPGLPPGLCIVSWDQDYVLSVRQNIGKAMGDHDLLMVMIDDWREDALSRGILPSRLAHVNLGVNTQLFRPAAAPCPCDYDLLFVGNIQPFEEYQKTIHLDRLDPISRQLMLHARERLADWVSAQTDGQSNVVPDLDAFLRQCLAELGHRHSGNPEHWRFTVHYFRYRIAHLLLRELYISALGEFRLGLFGRGWDRFPSVAGFAQPEVQNGQPLLDLIHRSAISIHLHTWTVHHPRLYDTAAAGGFLLVGKVPEANPLDRVFTPGEELDTFGSLPELKRKIRHYLNHPEQRQAMAAKAAQRAAREHAMEFRAAEMLQFIGKQAHV